MDIAAVLNFYREIRHLDSLISFGTLSTPQGYFQVVRLNPKSRCLVHDEEYLRTKYPNLKIETNLARL
jgi:hypothetical protein